MTRPLKVRNPIRFLTIPYKISEQYTRTITVDGKTDEVNYFLQEFEESKSRLTLTQLEVLDTAGAEQFNSLNEVYIKVRLALLAVYSSYLFLVRSWFCTCVQVLLSSHGGLCCLNETA